ncbi:MAG: hypothetical protein LH624_18015 [Cryobacterium sp.]|nr:hypothetical protein [Cryobacterium sp.]
MTSTGSSILQYALYSGAAGVTLLLLGWILTRTTHAVRLTIWITTTGTYLILLAGAGTLIAATVGTTTPYFGPLSIPILFTGLILIGAGTINTHALIEDLIITQVIDAVTNKVERQNS